MARPVGLAGHARIAANGPVAVQATKELVRMAASAPADKVRKVQAERRTTIFGSEDAKEGSLAFVERREPVWKGR